jgi:hypothetical protein
LESNGGRERVLTEYLRHYFNEDQTNWDEWVPYAMYMYNTTVHSPKGYTLFGLMYGFQSRLPSTLHETTNLQYHYNYYVVELKSSLPTPHDVAKQKLVTA